MSAVSTFLAMAGRRSIQTAALLALAGVSFQGAEDAVAKPALEREGESAAEVRAYWTPERLKTARPVRPAGGQATEPVAPTPLPSAVGSPGLRAPQPGAGQRSAAPLPLGRRPLGQVSNQTAFPQRANGKLFFVRGGNRYSCSASVVASRSDDVILTAGHCVYLWPEGWSKKLIFIPAYRHNHRPFGTWQWRSETIPRPWALRNTNYDYAAIELRPSRRGSVGEVVGELGLAWNYARQQRYRALGYPFNFFRGERMWQCVSGATGTDGSRLPGPPSTAIRCGMREGSSGGAWLIARKGNPHVASVTSHYYRDERSRIYGPYFDRKVLRLVNAAARG